MAIGQKQYCTNCGTAIASPGPGADIAARPAGPAAPVVATAPVAQPAPAAGQLAQASAPTPRPAQQFHAAPTGNRSSVLDLRQAPQPTPRPEPIATPTVQAPITASAVAPAPSAPAAPTVAPTAPVPSRREVRQANAASTARSEMVQKFPPAQASTEPTPVPAPVAAPAPEPTRPVPQPQIASAPIASVVAPVAAAATPAPSAAPALPNQVASQLQAMQNLISAGELNKIDPTSARKEAFKIAMADQPAAAPAKSGPRALSVAAAAFAVLIMGGYIWLQNYPKMAIRVAGNKAGIQASLPSYVPSNYSLNGPITYAPGQITLTFGANGSQDKMTIAERQTQWDSSSLLANYVSRKSKDYLAVQNQGLTIYLYNGNQASWVNKGIWYAIEGETKLTRDQVLKVASSL